MNTRHVAEDETKSDFLLFLRWLHKSVPHIYWYCTWIAQRISLKIRKV